MNARQPYPSASSPLITRRQEGPVPGPKPSGGFQEFRGDRYYVISDAQSMRPFFTCLVSASDHFLFASSNGALTCGRRNAGQSLFTYTTEDKIRDSYATTGPYSAFLIRAGEALELWEPFRESSERAYHIQRNLYKSARGDKLGFEELNFDLGVSFYYEWVTSEHFGFVRRSELRNLSATEKDISLLDGVQNLLPACVDPQMQLEFSCLLDAYKQNEHLGERLVAYSFAARITDRAEPQEALRASLAFSIGLPEARILVSGEQVNVFLKGGEVTPEEFVRGRRGAYFLTTHVNLAPSATQEWKMVFDVERSQAEARALLAQLEHPEDLDRAIEEDIQRGSRTLTEIVAQTDGLQTSADEAVTAHHFANVLFNDMRGGVFPNDYTIATEWFRRFVRSRNQRVWAENSAFLEGLPSELGHADLLARLFAEDNPDVARLGLEYLPLSFSRRHGDPSRPWNKFDIKVRDANGNMLLGYQGNWRDIFQNWEALCTSYPGYIECVIAKFVNASTVDGYNPYRITDAGIDWEEPEPDNPWAGIGYWGDHQIIYLLKLLELSRAHHPEALAGMLLRPLFSYANVPYRIKPYRAIRENPRDAIEFDDPRHLLAMQRAEQMGSDGKLLLTTDGKVYHVHLLEKLLVASLSKMASFVPGAGIWLNTQRPEWNDANNALVGNGVSMVTLYYLTRFFRFLEEMVPSLGSEPVVMSQEIAEWLKGSHQILEQHLPVAGEPSSETSRCELVDALGQLFSEYRERVYAGGLSSKGNVPVALVKQYVAVCRQHLEHTVSLGKRPGGLFHAYNIIRFEENRLAVDPLYEMLEGQVSVLSAGVLEPSEAADLLDSLRESAMYRPDQNSYMLYPNRQLPKFLEKNQVKREAVQSSALLARLASEKSPILQLDAQGVYRFAPELFNAEKLREALLGLPETPTEEQLREALAVYEQVFHHHSFTGRSGTMFAYEGLGSIYWHMAAKLLLAVQENFFWAEAKGASEDDLSRLGRHYYAIREGLGGFNKSPEIYGAFPMDPYSHTPESSPARQPGMTGQVKEEILTRLGELGVRPRGGRIRFAPSLLRRREFLQEPRSVDVVVVGKSTEQVSVPARGLLFTYCQVPVVYRLGETHSIRVVYSGGTVSDVPGSELSPEVSQSVFERRGEVARLEAWVTPGFD